ncbi:uncharacterized protein BDZ99DRAFT_256047 [Mytilinidion resinicola]|uniref:Uncharacterized protein n=1 Tax=Mytilinidion resinicola TaxID=574789 RepID=A0A6A6YZT7_9PEZI|nr:uncharacterized protein BDZ99DRAFT_256047 [Mytilinidion resinicola]KAF2813435.1 hypothetical protein BDZ99DRAFT_256047 [Mytilinidion resinicola]
MFHPTRLRLVVLRRNPSNNQHSLTKVWRCRFRTALLLRRRRDFRPDFGEGRLKMCVVPYYKVLALVLLVQLLGLWAIASCISIS